jgi:transcription-repair coupling factor (superfamily II helicase)
MDLSGLLHSLRALASYAGLLETLKDGRTPDTALHLPRAVRPAVVATLARDLARPILYLVPRADRVLTLQDELPAWDPTARWIQFPEPDPLFYEITPWSPRTLRQRTTVLTSLVVRGSALEGSASPPLILATARALVTRTLSPNSFQARTRPLRHGDQVPFDALVRSLVNNGYTHTSLVTEPCQFSRRGGILDLWPPAESLPVRLEFYGDEVESLRSFEPGTQRSTESRAELILSPAREGLPDRFDQVLRAMTPLDDMLQPQDDQEPSFEFGLPLMEAEGYGLLDYMPSDTLVVLDGQNALQDAISEIEQQAMEARHELIKDGLPSDFPRPHLTLAEVLDACERLETLDLGWLSSASQGSINLSDAFSPGPRFGGQIRPLVKHLEDQLRRGASTVLVSRQAPRLAEIWSERQPRRPVLDTLPDQFDPGGLYFVHGALSEGWSLHPTSKPDLHLLTDAEIFGWARPRPRPRPRRYAPAPEAAYADLNVGDWIVHVDFGIGIFAGLVERTLDDLQREYLLLEYAGGDQLYVPIHQADRITRYVGADANPPRASRLGVAQWERTKSKARKAIEEIARDLLELYAARHAVPGFAFSSDTPWQYELEASFPYVETPDQARALEAVKRDMEQSRPMDRLICGDVGYGKTEVALRAAFKAVMDGKQVAMLVPTTVLAQQHFHTFKRRLSAFPVKVEMLSRFRSGREAEQILAGLLSGAIDIVIGTHRLLQQDVRIKDLGLLIIDEEQRFGVTHKEFLKQKRKEVDVLTLTATPIPRTLYMALTGARDISTIDTPPAERLPVSTHVGAYDPRLVRRAVLRELDRGGQVFFVHNRVQTISGIKQQLERLIPEARHAVAHGQMPEADLSKVMDDFSAGEIDVLVSTSIIESGLDIPNANTLIVDRADWFGLAQLYQLRGRVGRGAAQGYAYFFHHAHRRSTQDAHERLETIAEHSQLGAGFSVAMRDLEIRGAGDLLGTRQHGHISAIGFHLYTRLLADAVSRMRTDLSKEAAIDIAALPTMARILPVSIDLPLQSVLPSSYVPERDLRLQLYRRMAEIRTLQSIADLKSELTDRFGPPPPEVENLFYQLRIRILATQAGIEGISLENGQILLQTRDGVEYAQMLDKGHQLRVSKRGLWMSREANTEWTHHLETVLSRLAERSPTEAHGSAAPGG